MCNSTLLHFEVALKFRCCGSKRATHWLSLERWGGIIYALYALMTWAWLICSVINQLSSILMIIYLSPLIMAKLKTLKGLYKTFKSTLFLFLVIKTFLRKEL